MVFAFDDLTQKSRWIPYSPLNGIDSRPQDISECQTDQMRPVKTRKLKRTPGMKQKRS
jgi:hypothetical protein